MTSTPDFDAQIEEFQHDAVKHYNAHVGKVRSEYKKRFCAFKDAWESWKTETKAAMEQIGLVAEVQGTVTNGGFLASLTSLFATSE